MIKGLVRAAALLVFCAGAGEAYAEGFALYEWSARGVALGGSTVARAPDASAVAYNPALMTRLKGINLMAGASVIMPDGKITFENPDETTKLKPGTWPVPHFYYTQQINDKFTVGVGEFTRFGLGFEQPHDWPGRFNIYQADLQSFSVNPNIAWAATDKLSLAAGVDVLYVNLDLKKRALAAVPGAYGGGSVEIDANIRDADAVGYGVNFAAHYQFNDEWAAGISYRSQVQVEAKGDIEYSLVQNNAMFPPAGKAVYGAAVEDGTASSTVVLPDSAAFGLAWTPRPDLSFEVGATWTNWRTFRTLRIHVPKTQGNPEGINETPKDWNHAWRFNVGAEWQALEWLALRAGYVYDQSPMTDNYADYIVPTDGRHIFSVGAGFTYENWTLDLAYAYLYAMGREFTANEEVHTLDGSESKGTRSDIFSMSLGYTF